MIFAKKKEKQTGNKLQMYVRRIVSSSVVSLSLVVSVRSGKMKMK